MLDDSGNLLLDAIEGLSEIFILDPRQVFGPGFEMRRQRKVLLIPYEPPHVMEGVVGLLLTARRLLDAGELQRVGEYAHASLFLLLLEWASVQGVAGESTIQDFDDIAVVFPHDRTP